MSRRHKVANAPRSRRGGAQKTIKDYFLPIVGVLIILLIFYSKFIKNGDEGNTIIGANEEASQELASGLITMSPGTVGHIGYNDSDDKKQITDGLKVFAGENIVIKEGGVTLKTTDGVDIDIDKIGELRFESPSSFTLYSSNIWVQTPVQSSFKLNFVTTTLEPGTVAMLMQNQVNSNVIILKGSAQVSNNAGKSTIVNAGQMVMVAKEQASDSDIDLGTIRGPIDDFIKNLDWFISHGGPAILDGTSQNNDTNIDQEENTNNANQSANAAGLVFSNVTDGGQVDSATTTIRGKFTNPLVEKITAGNIEAVLNNETMTFSISNVPTANQVNDIVIRTYDAAGMVIGKGLITLNNTGGSSSDTGSDAVDSDDDSPFSVENYPLNDAEFQFLAPKSNPYTTTASMVKIEGKVPVGIVDSIQVNGYSLQKFPSGGSYWAYFANSDFGNLKEGMNIYKINYIGKDGQILHTNVFTIVKNKAPAAPAPTPTPEPAVEEPQTQAASGDTEDADGESDTVVEEETIQEEVVDDNLVSPSDVAPQ